MLLRQHLPGPDELIPDEPIIASDRRKPPDRR
jgi:hypothetical protein